MEEMEYYHKGVKLMQQEDLDGAIAMFNRGMEEYPDSFLILSIRAPTYERKGERDKAMADYTRMIALEPRNPDGWNARGFMYQENKEYDKAIADFTACLPLSPPQYGTYWSNRGIAYYEKGDLNAALSDLNRSVALWMERGEEDGPEYASRALLYRGVVLRKMGNLDAAMADFTTTAKYEPEDSEVFYQMAYIWFIRGDFDRAIECFSRVIELKGNDAEGWLARGVCYWNKCGKEKIGFWDENGEIVTRAVDDFTRAIELAPDMAEAYFNRGTVRASIARESNNLIKAVMTHKAKDETERLMMLAQLDRMGGKDLVPQTDALLRGLRSNRDQLDVLMSKSAGLFARKDGEEAIEDLTRALELAPDNADAWYHRGLTYTLLGQREQALADYDRACDLNPDHEKALEKRAALRERMEQERAAE
jgi:tetratricopeptide (TPR) repeat protein